MGVLCLIAGLLSVGQTAVARVVPENSPQLPPYRIDEFAGWFHDAGNLLLHVSNRGRFGRGSADLTNPSGEWPAGSNNEYLYAAGLWIGGVLNRGGQPDTIVSAGLYQFGEYWNMENDEGCGSPPSGICETFEGAPSGLRGFDDDGDGTADEDGLDGQDNDFDGRIDEDFAGISQQMFRTVYYDTSTFANQFWSDPADFHEPLGLRIQQESYVWTDPQFDDFVGIEFTVTNISQVMDGVGWDVESAYLGFMVDGDIGIDDQDLKYWEDDQSGFATLDTLIAPTGDEDPLRLKLTMGYTFDEVGGDNANDDVPGYVGVLFLGHTVDESGGAPEDLFAPESVRIHAYRVWSGGDQDPRDDVDRYRFLRGNSDTRPTIDANTGKPDDYRFLVSAGPFAKIPPGSTLTFQVAFVCGEMLESFDAGGETIRKPDFTNPIQAQRVYNGFIDDQGEVIHWATSSPPPPPNVRLQAGDQYVSMEWDDFPEGVPDPLTREIDFAGYQVWKAEGWRREANIPSDAMWRLIADFDSTELAKIDTGLSGVGMYRFVDTRVHNGFWYWYAVTAYDRGVYTTEIDSLTTPGSPETTRVRTVEPKFGKYSQNMAKVMAGWSATQTLDEVAVVPNPYYLGAEWDLEETDFEPTGRRLRFINLPPRATIRIFSLSGDLVQTIEHHGGDGRTGEYEWTHSNLISMNNQDTVSGIYLYHVITPGGQETIGKFAVIR
ncbi:MAG: hypothetical protein QF819_03915 [Gemmatimonadota bacterium]|nr:hypothetical protein [Gemmatimonadota bacterium]